MGLPAPEIPTLHDDLWRSRRRREAEEAGRCKVISAKPLEGLEGARLSFACFAPAPVSVSQGVAISGAASIVPLSHMAGGECTSAGHLNVSVNLGILIPDGL